MEFENASFPEKKRFELNLYPNMVTKHGNKNVQLTQAVNKQ